MDLDDKIESTVESVKNSSSLKKYWKIAVLVAVGLWAWSAYNGLVKAEVPAGTLWANVEAEYQSRADKVKVITKIIENSANFEKGTLTEVIEARSKASSINLDANNLTPEAMANFEKAQGQLTGALSRLMMVVERYPNLKTTDAFRDFQTQYEGIENRISKARRDYNSGVNYYNIKVRKFPTNLMARITGFSEKPLFKSSPGAEDAPTIGDMNFNK